jgi:isoamyl acetate esterase
MKIISFITFIAVLMTGIKKQSKHIVFFGDSITQAGVQPGGYIMRIDSMCRKAGMDSAYTFTGAGIGGNKVYDLYLRMEKDVLAKKPDVVVIYVGVNDVWHKALSGTGTDADKFELFYQAIIDRLREKNIQIILCTPAVIGEKTDFSNPQDGELNNFSNIIRGLAAKNKLPLANLRKAFLDYNLLNNKENKEKGVLTTDRVHLNAKGNQLVADELWNVIKSL